LIEKEQKKARCRRRGVLGAGLAAGLVAVALVIASEQDDHGLITPFLYGYCPIGLFAVILLWRYLDLKPPRVAKPISFRAAATLIVVGAILVGVFSGVAAGRFVIGQHHASNPPLARQAAPPSLEGGELKLCKPSRLYRPSFGVAQ
jgi:hypothetical protein